MTQGIRLHVSGPFACFTRPEMKVERVSYDVMTPSAARGILEAIHWKPAIRWVIDAIHVLKPIRFQSIRRNEVGAKASFSSTKSAMRRGDVDGLGLRIDEKTRQQRASTVLVDVAYVIAAHFEMTDRAGPGDNPAKHADMFTRRATRGQAFAQPVLGTREFDARFALLPDGVPIPIPDDTMGLGFDTPRDLGFMLWDIDHGAPGKPSMFFRASLANGVVTVPQPGAPEILS
ncbi:type I-C CRISPR-associated protein Cas5 [Acuticoccus sediminis]|uniref:pre-crRNA processing endonuclease n=2 Tax=Acuticoccus sediminis TaxID=2184697 RepID=A0A8B2NLD3_9HYPH|nr:type I-C CRISPR-associated protein Cas5 [Acuticoccus sediminis]